MAAVPGVGSSSVGSGSTVSKEEEVHHPLMEEGSDESELELGLGLSIGFAGSKNYKRVSRILTAAEDLVASRPVVLPPSPSSVSSSCSSLGFRTSPTAHVSDVNSVNSSGGTKRASSPTAASSQVVGWPPIRAYRMNNMANQSKSIATGENFSEFEENKGKDVVYGTENKGNPNPEERVPVKNSLLVKVNMDGVAIGRKVNLSAHSSYELLAQTLEYMFTNDAVEKSSRSKLVLLPKVTRPSKLLNGSSEYVLTYEDKDGDWMLVGDVPWGMFLNSVKRLRIMRTSEANGLAPRSEERRSKQRSRPT